MVGLIALSVRKNEASLRITSNNFYMSRLQACQITDILEDQGCYSGFPALRLPTMANESGLPAM